MYFVFYALFAWCLVCSTAMRTSGQMTIELSDNKMRKGDETLQNQSCPFPTLPDGDDGVCPMEMDVFEFYTFNKATDKLDQGQFGAVYRAQDASGQVFAIKDIFDPSEFEAVELEPSRHNLPFVSQIVEAFQPQMKKVQLVYTMYRGGNLKTLLKKQYTQTFSPPEAHNIAAQLAYGLWQLHKKGYIHRDLKPANVMIDGSTFYICDYGLSEQGCNASNPKCASGSAGSPLWMGPGQFAGNRRYGPEADWHAFGVMLYQFLLGMLFHPFNQATSLSLQTSVLLQEPNLARITDLKLKDLLARLLSKQVDSIDPAAWFTEDVTKHPVLRHAYWLSEGQGVGQATRQFWSALCSGHFQDGRCDTQGQEAPVPLCMHGEEPDEENDEEEDIFDAPLQAEDLPVVSPNVSGELKPEVEKPPEPDRKPRRRKETKTEIVAGDKREPPAVQEKTEKVRRRKTTVAEGKGEPPAVQEKGEKVRRRKTAKTDVPERKGHKRRHRHRHLTEEQREAHRERKKQRERARLIDRLMDEHCAGIDKLFGFRSGVDEVTEVGNWIFQKSHYIKQGSKGITKAVEWVKSRQITFHQRDLSDIEEPTVDDACSVLMTMFKATPARGGSLLLVKSDDIIMTCANPGVLSCGQIGAQGETNPQEYMYKTDSGKALARGMKLIRRLAAPSRTEPQAPDSQDADMLRKVVFSLIENYDPSSSSDDLEKPFKKGGRSNTLSHDLVVTEFPGEDKGYKYGEWMAKFTLDTVSLSDGG